MRTYTVQGIILKRRNIGEADRILTVFTREMGKIQITAKGVRKIASKRASHIEPLNIVSLTLYKGSGMPVLIEATASKHFSKIKEDLAKVGLAYHMCELVEGLCPENQENRQAYQVFENVLHELEILSEEAIKLVHAFEVELLSLLGYWSEGMHDLSGAKASYFIESILERKLKARQVFPLLVS